MSSEPGTSRLVTNQKMFAVGEVKGVEDADGDPNGEFDVILSAPTLDRDGEVIDANAFEPLPDHITFDIDHGMSTATTVGSGVPFYDGGKLRVRGTYSSIPRAQEVRTLVREGHIRTTSVAFIAAKREHKDGVTHIVKAEVLNGAFVAIPSNRESVVLSSKRHSHLRVPVPDWRADLLLARAEVELAQARAVLAQLNPATASADVRLFLRSL
jgi:hypothetical protein